MSQPFFAQHAQQWDQLRASMFSEAVREAAFRYAALHPESVVADIGAGTGYMALGVAPLVAEVHLVDNSPEMLAAARANLASFQNISYHLADGASIPLPDESVDTILANTYLHHAPDPGEAILEMARLLKPGGRLVITDMDSHQFTWLRDEQDDIWLGFDRDLVYEWLKQAGLVNLLVVDTQQFCSADSQTGLGTASVSIFVAVGTKPQPEIDKAVKSRYREIAASGSSCCQPQEAGCCDTSPSSLITFNEIQAGPHPTSVKAGVEVGEEILSLGCGNPAALADLRPGEVVLDIGSGAGVDVFPAARRVGPLGKVIGLDMLEEMLVRARATAAAHGLENVEFRQGDAQAIPLEDNSVDVVMSNCVINLVQDKGQVFRGAYRVLKPGGRLAISDIVTDRPFSPSMRQDATAWSACVSGAVSEAEYLEIIKAAGFSELKTARSESWPAEDGTQVYSLNVSAYKALR